MKVLLSSVKGLLLKTANLCDRKFENSELKQKKEYFLRYCIKKAHQIIPEETFPSKEEEISLQNKLDVFQKMFYGDDISCNSNESVDEVLISQLDGANDSESSQEEEIIEKNMFGINCEILEIVQLVNFLRNCYFIVCVILIRQGLIRIVFVC